MKFVKNWLLFTESMVNELNYDTYMNAAEVARKKGLSTHYQDKFKQHALEVGIDSPELTQKSFKLKFGDIEGEFVFETPVIVEPYDPEYNPEYPPDQERIQQDLLKWTVSAKVTPIGDSAKLGKKDIFISGDDKRISQFIVDRKNATALDRISAKTLQELIVDKQGKQMITDERQLMMRIP